MQKNTDQQKQLIEQIKTTLAVHKTYVKRKSQGELIYDYLVPNGVYEEQWDWDAFFMGMALSSEIPTEGIYLRNVVLNLIHNSREDGYTPGCITPKGRDERLHQMKPFIAQAAYYGAKKIRDFHWLINVFDKLVLITTYREKELGSSEYNLAMWFNSMESGADNNLAALEYPDKSVIAVDCNSYLYREYIALSLIAHQIERYDDEKRFASRAEEIKNNINKYLWNEEDGSYYNLYIGDKKHIKRMSFSNFTALWVGIASPEQAKRMIESHLIKSDKMWSKFGIRTLSADDKGYNNVNMLKPYSNWQGPVWPIANYIYMHGLLRYGYQKEAVQVAERITKLVLDDIQKSGGMHENYDAETGEPLAAPNFVSWNLLVTNMLTEAITNTDPFVLP